MAISELLAEAETAATAVERKRYAFEQASVAHARQLTEAGEVLEKETAAANDEFNRCVSDAKATYDAAVAETGSYLKQAQDELTVAQSQLEALRSQVNNMLGDLLGTQNPRVKVSA